MRIGCVSLTRSSPPGGRDHEIRRQPAPGPFGQLEGILRPLGPKVQILSLFPPAARGWWLPLSERNRLYRRYRPVAEHVHHQLVDGAGIGRAGAGERVVRVLAGAARPIADVAAGGRVEIGLRTAGEIGSAARIAAVEREIGGAAGYRRR